MSKPKIATALTAILMASFIWGATASAGVIDRIVAQVNEEIVTLYELEEAALPFLIQQGQNPQLLTNEARRAALLEEVLEDLVDRILVQQEADKEGVQIAEQEIDQWMAQTRQQQGLTEPQFRQMIAQYGIEYEDYRQIIRDNLLRMRVLQMRARGGGVSESEVESVYRRRYGADMTERYVEVRHILLVPDQATGGEAGARERAAELRERIEGGESFEEIAEANSQGPGASDGGYLGSFRRGQLDESFEEVIFSLPEGELSQPIATPFGIHLIEILSVEERAGENVEQRKGEIRAWLQQRQMERQMESFLQTLRARAFVDIRY